MNIWDDDTARRMVERDPAATRRLATDLRLPTPIERLRRRVEVQAMAIWALVALCGLLLAALVARWGR